MPIIHVIIEIMKKIFKYLFLLLIIILVLGGGFLVLKNFKIQKITCESQYGQCTGNLQFLISNLQTKKQNILQTRADLNNLLKADNSILSYSINFQLPNSFKVNVVERKAIVAYATKMQGFDLVDSEGNILTQVSVTNLPKITTSINLGHDQIVFISNLMNRLNFLYKVNSGKVTADGFFVDNIYGKKVIFPLVGDQDILLGSLALIISRLPSVKEASTISVIDLRYKNPVLR